MRRFLHITPTVRVHLTSRSTKAPLPKKHGTVRDPLQSITNVSAATLTTTPSTAETHGVNTRAGDVSVSDPTKPELSPSLSDFDFEIPYFPRPFFRICKIQEGSHGKTEAVRDINGGREGRDRVLCVKIFHRTAKSKAFEQELAAYMALSRATTRCGYNWLPFVMRLEASLEEPDRTFFVMDVMCADLEDILSKWDRNLRKTRIKQWVAQMTTGLAAIHDAGIIHRDLKPENVFVDFRFNARIGDFGCAYIEPQGKPIYRFGDYCREVCGTWPYTAPEMADNTGRHIDCRRDYSLSVDYWALGCIVFELEREGAGALFENLADLRVYRNYQPLRHRGKSYFAFAKLSLNAESLISGLLRPRPAHRYSYHEVRRHQYFKKSDGSSEFDNILEQGRAIHDLPVGEDVPCGHFQADDHPLVVYCPSIIDTQHEFGDSNSWINPYGIWGTRNRNLDIVD